MSTISKIKIGNTTYNLKDANAAASTHTHSANDITSDTLPIANGGTGATTAADAVTNIVDGQIIEPKRVIATNQIAVIDGNVYTQNGSIYTNEGNIRTYSGSIYAQNGDVIIKDAVGTTDLHKLSKKANIGHEHSASDITSGTLPIAQGGSGQSGLVSEYVVANVATAGAGCSILGVQYHQWGKVAQLYIGIKCNSAKNSGDVLATILSGKQPKMTTPLTNLANASQFCAVYNDGKVQAKSSLTTGAEVYVIGTYLLP